jgi:nitroreductase
VLLKNGAFIYDAQNNKLIIVTPEDLRSQAADQKFANAPVQLIFVADLAKRGESTEDGKLRTANIDCGYISQNTYLFCTSEGLVTGARGSVNRNVLTPKLKLRVDQRILLAHSVGHPVK